ncbi:hypothetical protein LOTGIDRAFT_154991 [Lottia gigantea]|uniref:MADF domain-containing protein n=1 Tax=Lottia gigantea TaxID=225164 RepID=V3Z4B0_LOTGI|nr:hypothetical protein LOTGIDRAFT_154991 [Lottia gigantea]ESO85503.1 hypothetical protein LOTGIDRAFT_154991 [Lottia gigantea]
MLMWTDQAVQILLDGLQNHECLWNLKSKDYKDRGMKKIALGDLLESLKKEILDFESQGTGSGAADIYTPKWKFFNSCSFLEGVVAVESGATVSNLTPLQNNEDDNDGEGENSRDLDRTPTPETPKLPHIQSKRRKRESTPVSTTHTWMDTASHALKTLADSAKETTDEWDDFAKDVANTLRGIPNKSTQRRTKFAIQKVLFDAGESDDHFIAPQQSAQPQTQWVAPNYNLNNTGRYMHRSPVKYMQIGGAWPNGY